MYPLQKLEANHITHSWSLSLAKCWVSLQVTSTIPSKQNTCSTMYLHLSTSYHLGNLRGYPTSLFIQGLHLGPMVGIIHHHLETIKAHALELFSSRHVRRIGLVQRWGALRWKIGDWCHTMSHWRMVKQIMLIHILSAGNRMLWQVKKHDTAVSYSYVQLNHLLRS